MADLARYLPIKENCLNWQLLPQQRPQMSKARKQKFVVPVSKPEEIMHYRMDSALNYYPYPPNREGTIREPVYGDEFMDLIRAEDAGQDALAAALGRHKAFLDEQKRKAKWGKILKKAKQDLAWHAPTPWVPYIPKDVRKVRRFLRKWPVEWKEYVGMSVGGALLPPKPASRARRGETIAEDAEGEEEAEREWEEQQERVKLWARRQKEEEEREEREADEREKKGKKPVPIWAMKAKGVRRQEKTAAETVREIPAPNSGLPPVAGVQGLPAAYNAIWQ